jgi:high-affinity nickel permease
VIFPQRCQDVKRLYKLPFFETSKVPQCSTCVSVALKSMKFLFCVASLNLYLWYFLPPTYTHSQLNKVKKSLLKSNLWLKGDMEKIRTGSYSHLIKKTTHVLTFGFDITCVIIFTSISFCICGRESEQNFLILKHFSGGLKDET